MKLYLSILILCLAGVAIIVAKLPRTTRAPRATPRPAAQTSGKLRIYVNVDAAHSPDGTAAVRRVMQVPGVRKAWFIGGWQVAGTDPVLPTKADQEAYHRHAAICYDALAAKWDGRLNAAKLRESLAFLEARVKFEHGGGCAAIGTAHIALALDAKDPATSAEHMRLANQYFDDGANPAMAAQIRAAADKAARAGADLVVFDIESPGWFLNINLGLTYHRAALRRHRIQNAIFREQVQHLPVSHWCLIPVFTGNPEGQPHPDLVQYTRILKEAEEFCDFAVSPVYGDTSEFMAQLTSAKQKVDAIGRGMEYIPSIHVEGAPDAEWFRCRLSQCAKLGIKKVILWFGVAEPLEDSALQMIERFAKDGP